MPLGDVFGVSTTGYWATQMRCGEHENDLNQCHYTVYRNQLAQTCSVGYSANVQWLGKSVFMLLKNYIIVLLHNYIMLCIQI